LPPGRQRYEPETEDYEATVLLTFTLFSGGEDFVTATVRNPEFGIRNQPLVAAKGRAVNNMAIFAYPSKR
jgi:hypothetical protein